jgi:hypothetical protein
MGAFRRSLAAGADRERLKARHERHRASTRRLPWLASALFAALFVVTPALLPLGEEATPFLVATVAVVLVLHVAVVLQARRALRECEAPGSSVLMALALFPPGAMHAPLAVAKDLYADFRPLAIAASRLDAAAFEDLARRERHRVELGLAGARGTDREEHWQACLEALDEIVASAGANATAVRSPPPRTDEGTAAYCPLCFTEYRAGFEDCADCGVPLRRFDAPASASATPRDAEGRSRSRRSRRGAAS